MLVFLLTVWATMVAARGTPIGDAMHRVLVAAPARWLSRITRGHVLLAGAVLMFAITVIWVMQADGIAVLGMASPDLFVMLSMVDASVLIDTALVAIAAASVLRMQTVRHWLGYRLAPRRPRTRAMRVRRERPPANDDEDRPALLAA